MRTDKPKKNELFLDDNADLEGMLFNPRARGPVATGMVQQCAKLIDSVGIPELLAQWDQEVHAPVRGGRPASVPMRGILILWLVLAWEHQPLQLKKLRDIITERLTPETAAILGINLDAAVSPDGWYERARRSTNRIMSLIDYHPVFNRHRRLQKKEWDKVRADREEIAEVLSVRAHRADELMNLLLHATYLWMPKRLRSDKVSVTIDATAVRVHARGVGVTRLSKLGAEEPVSIEPDAAFWARGTEDHSDDGKTSITKMKYAYELELGVLTSNDPTRPEDIPHIVVGIGHHAPAFGPGKAARAMFENIVSRGLQLDHVIGDRAYLPGAKEADLQNYLRSAGAKLVMDYHKTFLGYQDSYAGAIMVDGNWYCASMPQMLIDASKRYREGEDADDKNRSLTKSQRAARAQSRLEQWQSDVEARAPYLFSRKELPDAKGRTPWMCPAAGNSPTAACPRKPTNLGSGKVPLTIIRRPVEGPAKVCDNKTSTTFPAEAGGKFAQEYQYGSKEWREMYGHGRNSVESFNAYLKDGGTHALEDGSRRRLRGSVAQYFLATMTVVAANLDKIIDFAAQKTEDGDDYEAGIEAPRAKQRKPRRTTALQRVTHNRGRARRNPVRT
ncbi:hypothetical protein ACFWCH_12505 [Microbacterium sp. NPDC060132]|uniref:hypothetical protein n=1 Tax=unclassified Microbacterium TaxID=2609290 RepID=UPI0036479959